MKAYIGTLGIGKTFELTKHLYNTFYKHDCMIITNYNTSFSTHVVKDREQFTDILKELLYFKTNGYEPVDLDPKLTNSAVAIAIDEAHLIFTSDFYKENRKDKTLLALMSQARKLNIHIFVTSQSVHKLDKDLRTYIDEYVAFKPVIPIRWRVKVNKISKDGHKCYTREIRYLFPLFRALTYALPPDEPFFDDKYYLRQELVASGYLNSSYYKMYDSNELINHETEVKDTFQLLSSLRTMNASYSQSKNKKVKQTKQLLSSNSTQIPPKNA